MSVISGAYAATWDGDAIGNVELGGIRERYSYTGKEIKFDAVGQAPVDILFGAPTLMLDFVCMEYDAAAIDAMRWPWHAISGQAPASGASMWQLAKEFILTSCRSDINPQTKTFYKTILAPGFEVQLDYSGVKERSVPIRLMCFPVKYSMENDYTPALYPAGCLDMVYYTETFVSP